MKSLPVRPRSHILEDESKKFVNQILPTEWIIENGKKDYGIDLVVEIVKNNQVTGAHFLIQLKSTDNLKTQQDKYILHSCQTSTLKYFLERPELVIYIVYDAAKNIGYWLWAQDYIRNSLSTGWSKKKSLTIKIPKSNAFTKKSISIIEKRVLSYHEQSKLLMAIQTSDNPYIGYRINIGKNSHEILAYYKYPGAEKDYPITFDVKFKFDETIEGKKAQISLQDAMKRGIPAEIDGKFIENAQLPTFPISEQVNNQEFKTEKLFIQPLNTNKRFSAKIEVLDKEENVIAQVPHVEFKEVRSGTDEILFSNESQITPMKFTILTRPLDKTLSFSFTLNVTGLNALQAKDVFHLQNALATGSSLRIFHLETGIIIADMIIPNGLVSEPSEKTIEFSNDLAFIQQNMKTIIPWPTKITGEEQYIIKKIVDIIKTGKSLEGNYLSFSLEKSEAQKLANSFEKNEKMGFIFESRKDTLDLFDQKLDFGPGRFLLQKARPTKETFERFSSLEVLADGASIQIELEIDEPGVILEHINWLPNK